MIEPIQPPGESLSPGLIPNNHVRPLVPLDQTSTRPFIQTPTGPLFFEQSNYAADAEEYDGYDIHVEYTHMEGLVGHSMVDEDADGNGVAYIQVHQPITGKIIYFTGTKHGEYPPVPNPYIPVLADSNLVLLSAKVSAKPIITSTGRPDKFMVSGTYAYGFKSAWTPGDVIVVPSNPLSQVSSPSVPASSLSL